MACRPYNTGRCLLLRLFNCPNFGVHFSYLSLLFQKGVYINNGKKLLKEGKRSS